MSDPRKASFAHKRRYAMLAQWRGVADGPLVDLPTRNLSDILGKVVKSLGLEERSILEEVLAAWKSAVGDFIARHTMPDAVTKGVLTVRVSQASVHHALMMEKPVILRKLNAGLVHARITDLRFRNG
jgi:predicted nucleic acid-binding Zn ribbon protein